jgi:two-component system, NtrC family, sensor kinase
MTPDNRFRRYQDFQRYVGWTEDDAQIVRAVAPLLDPHLGPLVDDFYAEIERHPATRKVITGGLEQVERLKSSLIAWLRELLSGPYDQGYVERRLRVGQRHVQIGLDQVYTNVALSRMRSGLMTALAANWAGDRDRLVATIRSLNKLLDLDLVKIEDAYQAAYLALQQRAERLATIGEVGSGVAHELRNPLNNIKTSAYYLLNAKNPTPEKRDEHLRRIQQQVQVADRVITTLSNYAKMPVPDLHPTDVPRVAEEAATENAPPANVRVVHGWPAELPPALADPDQLRIVLSNLIRNALDAMPSGGTLTLSGRTGDNVEVAVTDTGVGMSAEQLSRISEPLFTTKAKGLGLGLALSRTILERNRGSLHVTSQVGVGTTFTVRLTVAPPARTDR